MAHLRPNFRYNSEPEPIKASLSRHWRTGLSVVRLLDQNTLAYSVWSGKHVSRLKEEDSYASSSISSLLLKLHTPSNMYIRKFEHCLSHYCIVIFHLIDFSVRSEILAYAVNESDRPACIVVCWPLSPFCHTFTVSKNQHIFYDRPM